MLQSVLLLPCTAYITIIPTATCTSTEVLLPQCRLSRLERSNDGHTATQQGHMRLEFMPSSLQADGNTCAHSFASAIQDASSKAGSRPAADRGKEEEAKGHPCSHFAWELQDLHNRMAAAIAQIRCAPRGTVPGTVPRAQHHSQEEAGNS